MTRQRSGREVPITQVRSLVGDRLREQKYAIEQEIVARTSLFSLGDDVDPEYVMGLKESIPIALEYGIACVECSERSLPPVPTRLYAQARLAARNGVDASTVIRRYVSGFNLLRSFVEEAILAEDLAGTRAAREIQRVSAFVIDRLVAEISEHHADETRKQATSPEATRIGLVRKQLAGEPIEPNLLNYDFEGFHVGVVANGSGAATAIKSLAKTMDCIELTVEPTVGSVWAWLGKRTPPDIDRIEKLVSKHWPSADAVAIGEIGAGVAGWRLTYQQAMEGFLVGLKRGGFFRYGDDPILATVLSYPLLEESIRQLYLAPLMDRSDGDKLCETLSAYFAAKRNSASAGSALGVKRQTVAHRLKQVEATLGCRLDDRGAEIDVALRLAALDGAQPLAAI